MDITLIDVDDFSGYAFKRPKRMPLGLLNVAAMTQQLGHSVEIIRKSSLDARSRTERLLPEQLAEVVCERPFDIIGLNTRCDTLPFAIECARQCKLRRSNAPVVLGGPGCCFVDREIISAFEFIDVIVRGEGEYTFAELSSAFEKQASLCHVKGLTFRREDGEIAVTPDRPAIEDLDSLPRVPYQLAEDVLLDPKTSTVDVLVGRGCPNRCSFCSTCSFWGDQVRMRSAGTIVSEIQYLRTRYGVRHFSLVHDNILCRTAFIQELCKLIREALTDVTFGISASPNFCRPEIIKTLAHSGCSKVFLGVETGSPQTVRNIRRKAVGAAELRGILQLFREYGIQTTQSYIIGFPGESIDDINQTLLLASELASIADGTQVHPLSIHPGTKLYEDFGDTLKFTSLICDFADHSILDIPACLDMCRRYPRIFTAYSSYKSYNEYEETIELANLFVLLIGHLPKIVLALCKDVRFSPATLLRYVKDNALSRGIDVQYLRGHPDADQNAREQCLRNVVGILEGICERCNNR